MKRISLFALPLLFIFSACSTDFELEAPYRDIPIVYGMLSVDDTAHYVRVEKAFLPKGADARDAAQVADSLYYGDNVTVQLQNLRTGNVFTLQKVDGALEGYPREDGPFATVPNYLYKVKASTAGLLGGDGIRLLINRGDDLPQVTAETQMVEPLMPLMNGPATPVRIADYDRETIFRWTAGSSAKVFDLRLVLRYRETLDGNPANFLPKELEWVLTEELERPNDNGETQTYSIDNESFYIFLKSRLEVNPAAIRVFDFIDFHVTGAGQELVDLLDIVRINGGITSSQSIPKYSNISEGLGILTSRASGVRRNLQLDAVALDSLRLGIHTKNLNFQ